MYGHREFPGASYDAWKTRAPEDERWYCGEEDEPPCECGNTGWLSCWHSVEPCHCCCAACPDIEDAYERSPTA